MSNSIYIVEDEAIVALDIKRAIAKLGYTFAGMSSNYEDAIKGIKKVLPDLILLDITLKYSKNGIEVAKELKKTHTIPIIYLTSITDELTMYDAIATEPYGYLLKPFRREELHSSILLGLHKASEKVAKQAEIFYLGYGYSYNMQESLLFYAEQHVSLGKKECRLLDTLVSAKGEVVSFYMLEEIIWQGTHISESAFRTLLYRLNLKLEHKLIESIPGYGCRLILDEI